MAATYVDHEQAHQRPGLMYFLMAMVVVLPVLLVILSYVFSYRGST